MAGEQADLEADQAGDAEMLIDEVAAGAGMLVAGLQFGYGADEIGGGDLGAGPLNPKGQLSGEQGRYFWYYGTRDLPKGVEEGTIQARIYHLVSLFFLHCQSGCLFLAVIEGQAQQRNDANHRQHDQHPKARTQPPPYQNQPNPTQPDQPKVNRYLGAIKHIHLLHPAAIIPLLGTNLETGEKLCPVPAGFWRRVVAGVQWSKAQRECVVEMHAMHFKAIARCGGLGGWQ